MKKLVRLLNRMFIVLAISFALAEFVLQIFDPIGIKYFQEVGKYLSVMVDDPNFAYIHQKNNEGRYQGVTVRTNELGLRWHPIEKESRERPTVLLLGDSVIFGWGVEQDLIVANKFRDLLDQNNIDAHVISAGVGSWNTRTEYEFLRVLSDIYEIDYVILLIIPNDIEPKDKGMTSVPLHLLKEERLQAQQKHRKVTWWSWRIERVTEYSLLLQTFVWILNRETQSAYLLELYRNRGPSWQDSKEALKSLIDLCEEKEIKLIPYIRSHPDSPFHQDLLSLYAPIVEDAGVTLSTVDPDGFGHKNSMVDGHPDAKGHQLMADQMYSNFMSQYYAEQGGRTAVAALKTQLHAR